VRIGDRISDNHETCWEINIISVSVDWSVRSLIWLAWHVASKSHDNTERKMGRPRAGERKDGGRRECGQSRWTARWYGQSRGWPAVEGSRWWRRGRRGCGTRSTPWQERARRYAQAREQEPVWDLEQRERWGRLRSGPAAHRGRPILEGSLVWHGPQLGCRRHDAAIPCILNLTINKLR
jgi:hypothetical protein